MNQSARDTGRRIDAWMADAAPVRAPGDLLEQVFAATSRSSQQRPFPIRVPGLFRDLAWRPAAALALVALLALLTAAVLLVSGGRANLEPSPSPDPRPSVSAGLLTTPAIVEARITIPGAPADLPLWVAATSDAVWVTTDGAVVRIDPATNETTIIPVPVPANALIGIAASEAGVFIVDRMGLAIHRIDPATNAVVARIPVAGGPFWVVADETSAWVLLRDAGTIERIDLATNTVVDSFPAPTDASSMSHVPGALWIGTLGGTILTRLDDETGAVVAEMTMQTGTSSCGPGPVASEIWTTGCFGTTLVGRADPATDELIDSLDVEGLISGIAAVGSGAWITQPPEEERPGRIVHIGPQTDGIDRVLTLGPTDDADAPVALDGALWVPLEGQGVVLRIAIPADVAP